MYRNQLIISESERTNILSKHSKYRNILIKELNRTKGKQINEDTPQGGQPWIQGYKYDLPTVIKYCFATKPAEFPNVQPGTFGANKQPAASSDDNNGTFLILTNIPNTQLGGWTKYIYTYRTETKPDGTTKRVYQKNPKTSNWKCEALESDTKQEMGIYQGAQVEGDKIWLTAAETKDTEQNLNDKNKWIKQTFPNNNQTLYRRAYTQPVTGKDSQELAAEYVNLGYIVNPTPKQIQMGNLIQVTTKDLTGILPQGWKLYMEPDAFKNVDFAKTVDADITSQSVTDSECRKVVRKYFELYRKGIRSTDGSFCPIKQYFRACKNEFQYSWSKIRIKKDETRDLLEILALMSREALPSGETTFEGKSFPGKKDQFALTDPTCFN